MELTISIKGQKNISEFLNLIRTFEYIEIIDVKEETSDLPVEHIELLDKRLQKVEEGKTSYQKWDVVKKKYEDRAL
ncbi:MAG: hypothetical protein FD170_1404 [Bacteroidetes bacterium]|jgi:hypothetical protein|nr:MAG: hypothetical protein FD170_1404 [Bacteroidota bacterium]